ncbi:MAG: imelysin family protein [Pseudomonadota bacterium]
MKCLVNLAGSAAIASVLMVSGCFNSDNKLSSVSESDVIANMANIAGAMYSDSLTDAKTLKTKIDTFVASPTEETLESAREAYKDMRVAYQQSEIFRWDEESGVAGEGTGADDGKGVVSVDSWEGQVNAWPLDEAAIDGIISSSAEISKGYLIAQNGIGGDANVTTGIHAIEYLLWGLDTNKVGKGTGERPATDYDKVNCSVGHCARRGEYLSTAAALLVSDLDAMANEWTEMAQATSGTLANNFINSSKALDYVVTAMQQMSGPELAGARMSVNLDSAGQEEDHDCFSDLSHVAIYHNFQGIKAVFSGDYLGATPKSGAGINDLVSRKSSTTSSDLNKAFDAIEGNMKIVFDAGESGTRFDHVSALGKGNAVFDAATQVVNDLTALTVSGGLYDDMEAALSVSNVSVSEGEG